ncbi:hypothetical protein [Desulfolucanica intricata]|uniref:hypothetical protein n=1 Tax=Desulfolucanica intricata TaxID=1285191 RepID=UPI000829537F|nr:hypothetical protein [Desulfolucanica intricata]
MCTVYVLGAGASAGYKGSLIGEQSPVASNFFQKAAKVRHIHKIGSRSFGDEKITYHHLFNFINKFWGISETELELSTLDMEEVLTLLHIELEENPNEFLHNANQEYLLLMALTFEKILYGETCLYHLKIAKNLKPGDIIISFNYESLIDNALLVTGTDRRNPLHWNLPDGYGIPCLPINNDYSSSEQSNVLLLKMHGSFNWLYCFHCHNLYSQIKLHENGYCFFNLPWRASPCIKCGRPLNQVLIPPTQMKSYDAIPFIEKIWRQALMGLARAKKIVVIGYSFPPTDFRSKWLFRKALSQNNSLEKVIAVNHSVGPKKEILLNMYKDIFKIEEIKTYKDIADYTSSL